MERSCSAGTLAGVFDFFLGAAPSAFRGVCGFRRSPPKSQRRAQPTETCHPERSEGSQRPELLQTTTRAQLAFGCSALRLSERGIRLPSSSAPSASLRFVFSSSSQFPFSLFQFPTL